MSVPSPARRVPVVVWLLVPLAVAVALAVLAGRSDTDGTATTSSPPDGGGTAPTLVDVHADAGPAATTLDALVAASDVVVRGRVAAIERGRAIGTASQGIVTRLVRVQVDDVLAGDASAVGTDGVIVVEEEGWLPDGRAVRVNGVEASAVDDAGVWFLVRGRSEEFPYTAVVSEQGRYLTDSADPSRFAPSGSEDALVHSIEALGPEALATQIRSGDTIVR